MPHGKKLRSVLAALVMLAGPLASAQQTPEPAPQYGTPQQLFDSHQAHYAAMIAGFNTATGYARNHSSSSPRLACDFYKQALVELSDAQADLNWIISALEEGHQDAAQYHASLDENATNW